MTDNKRKCFKCGSTNTDPDVVLYRFPRPGVKNMLRCELWAKYSFPDRPWSSPDFQKKLFSEHRMLCHKHFKESSFIDFSIKKLHRHAAPDIECDKTLRQCFNAGLKVSATVCDMGGTNQRALKSLGATESNPVIKIDDKEVIALFDAPHLLKCFRNMFMKYDIKCKTNISSGETSGEGLAKWSHIKQFYEIDKCNPNFVFAPSLTKEHLEPNAKQKMKVNLAAQIFSHTVAAGMFSKVAEGQLPAAAAVTATVLSKMDKLFDLLNSDTQDLRGGKPYATNMSEKSPHKPYFEEMIIFFKSMSFVGCTRQPPSLEGWVWTLNGLQMLWQKFKIMYPDVGSLATRRLQQDPLENLFGCIRGNCGSNTNPTTSSFIGGMKTAIISNLAHISSGNCEMDNNKAIIDNFKTLLSTSAYICTENNDPVFDTSEEHNIEDGILENTGELQACAYVCGFLIKNNKYVKECINCKKIFVAENIEFFHNFVENKEYYEYKKSLNYASQSYVDCVEKCATLINSKLNEDASKKYLSKQINYDKNNFNFLQLCATHFDQNLQFIQSNIFHVCVRRFCTLKNRFYAEEASKSALKKQLIF